MVSGVPPAGGGGVKIPKNIAYAQVATQLKMADLQDLRYIYMVGGFCASPLLQDAIREEFDDPGRDLKVVVAPRPGLAVVRASCEEEWLLSSCYFFCCPTCHSLSFVCT